jgi:hypothetical protein
MIDNLVLEVLCGIFSLECFVSSLMSLSCLILNAIYYIFLSFVISVSGDIS